MDAKELRNRTKQFAHRCVKLSLALPENRLGNHIRKQLIRCVTSVASNDRATCLAQSKAAFVSKLSIFLKEANESMFWMQCLTDEHLFENHLVSPLLVETRESTAVFVAARKTAKNRTGEFEDDCRAENNNQ